MDRIDDPTAEADKFGSGKNGFTNGDPGLVDPTRVPAEWLNGVQEEIMNVVEDAGLTPDPDDLTQLLTALDQRAIYATYTVSGTGIASGGARYTLTLDHKNGNFALASNDITVPFPGIYLVTLIVHLTNAGTSNPEVVNILSSPSGGLTLQAQRFSATNTIPMLLSGCTICQIDEPVGSNPIGLSHSGGNNQSVDAAGAQKLSIYLLRKT